MTNLPQTALAFCRECLGWEDARIQYSSNGVIWNGKLKENSKGFHFTDLNAVIKAVRGWCDSDQELRIVITEYNVCASIWIDTDQISDIRRLDSSNHDLSHALLAACVETARKMKESA